MQVKTSKKKNIFNLFGKLLYQVLRNKKHSTVLPSIENYYTELRKVINTK